MRTLPQAAWTAWLALVAISGTARADTFGTGANEFTIDFVEVGDAGNPDDSGTTGSYHSAFGAVDYVFRIGKYEVSREMIDKANAEGSLGLTMQDMTGFGAGNAPAQPAVGISWNEAARFVNWLNDKAGFSHAYKFALQPGEAGYDPTADIELWQSGDTGYDPANPFRNSGAKYFLPSEDEWYKAAYYSGADATYFDYPTQQDAPDVPTPIISGTDPGTAVYDDQTLSAGPAEITQAGGLSHYGTMAQGGNLWEWVESAFDSTNDSASENRVVRGGGWYFDEFDLRSATRSENAPAAKVLLFGFEYGFRVASATEPGEGAPEIVVEDESASDVANGDNRDFGIVPVGGNSEQTFTIRNTGDEDLTGLGITKSGPGAADFVIAAAPVAPVSPGGSTTFTIGFAPGTSGAKWAAIQIANNDPDENPFHLTLSGATSAPEQDTFGSGANEFTIDFVEVVDAGNPDDNGTTGSYHGPYGGVDHVFRIGKYQVSRGMVGKANAEGNLGLTMLDMENVGFLGVTIDGGNDPGQPVTGITWHEAARFVNWLNEDVGFPHAYKFAVQPGETGYNPLAAIELWQTGDAGYDPANPYRNVNARYFLPSEDEWYKAAYYSGAGGTYFDYPTQQDAPDAPTPVVSGTDPGTAVYDDATGFQGPADVTQAGGLSHYGTMAQGGNMWEWTESAADGTNDSPTEDRVDRGGAWWDPESELRSSTRYGDPPDGGGIIAFRVASMEPAAGGEPEIVVEDESANDVANGASRDFGIAPVGEFAEQTFTIRNTGDGDLTGLGITVTGADAADFVIPTQPVAPVSPGGSTTFTIRFAPLSSGVKAAAIEIASNDADENPFGINLSGHALSDQDDTDSDGMNDVAEWKLAALGFDWQVDNSALVDLYFENASLNGLFAESQVHTLRLTIPSITPGPSPDQFTLTTDWQRSSDGIQFVDHPANPAEVSVDGNGDIQFEFPAMDGAKFLILQR